MEPESIMIAQLSWPQVKDALAQGYRRVVLAVGATEQHGPHLPTGTDTIIGDALAREAARQAGGTLVAPTVPVGVSAHHLGFAGSMSIAPGTLQALLEDQVRSLALTGFERIVLLPFHGGNFQAVQAAVSALAGDPDLAGVVVAAAADLAEFIEVMLAVSADTPAACGAHAGESETSIMLHLVPERVRMEAAVAGFMGELEPLIPVLWQEGMRAVSPVGVIGDPTRATGERGRVYFQALVDYWVGYICGR